MFVKANERDLKKLGKRISDLRSEAGMTLEQLAYEMELSKGNLSEIERGLKDPRYSTLKLIAEGLEKPLETLLKGL